MQGSFAGVLISEVSGPPWVTDAGKVQVIPRVSVNGHRTESVATAEISRFL